MISMSSVLFSAGTGALLGFLYALLFLIRSRSALLSESTQAPSQRALITIAVSPVGRLALFGCIIGYLLLYTAINLILMMLFFLAIFWAIIINHERLM